MKVCPKVRWAERSSGPHVDQGGFTLIEVIAILVIVGVISAFIFQRGGTGRVDLAAELGILKTHLRYAQALAMNNNTASWDVNFTASGYQLRRDGAAAPVNLPGESSAAHNFHRNLSLTQGSLLLPFDEWGSPGPSDVTLTLTDGARSASLTVTRSTGMIP